MTRPFLAMFVLMSSSLVASLVSADAPETQPVLLQMIRDDAVHRELELTENQIRQVKSTLADVDGPWFRVRIRPAEERIEKIGELQQQLENSLSGILDASQRKRLEQLQNQALGTRMVVRDRVATALKLSEEDRESLYKLFRETDRVSNEAQEKLRAGELDAQAAAEKIKKAQFAERKSFTDRLTTDQRIKLADLTGDSFNFSKVKRTYPSAPELTLDGAEWLQGSPQTLKELRGKVVAVHFYAFQCINCRRNLPHYNAWQTDYADDGLVIIGIQTPETSRERDPDAVATAIKDESIEYPVLMDTKSSNWQQWSNTMWPTVYLIDKQGYLRRWWQGEMNWKDTPGEKQMRETIEMLLAENDK
ncbi:redoxin domain-containing protein [Stieleria sp. JC731]|uniref:redoxin domain-containing protein n=1 Tax=Pirellulaceae TaxID=2691357 RepID=UPI001E6471A9|nr:redoxin domain-containing protein [Stieleria sp. JC731]MCC9604072.1 redoxin domain-containing protein [Stieleria sp. JC731]